MILTLLLAGCVERTPDPTLAIAAAVGRAAQSIRVPEYRWCPPTLHGAEYTHFVLKESDAADPVLICFYRREK